MTNSYKKNRIFIVILILCLSVFCFNSIVIYAEDDCDKNANEQQLNNEQQLEEKSVSKEEVKETVKDEIKSGDKDIEEIKETSKTEIESENKSLEEEPTSVTTDIQNSTLNDSATKNKIVNNTDKQTEKIEEQVKEEDIEYPFVVTFHFFFRDSNGWRESSKFSYTIKDKTTKSGTKAISYYEKQIINNKLDTVTCGMTTYTYTGKWVGNGQTLTASDRVQIIGADYTKATDVNFYAQYTEEKNVYLSMNYIDKIAHGSGSWSNEDAFSGYTHTFSTPADIPEHYQFMYWENTDSSKQYSSGDSISINTSDLDEDTEIDIYAIYQPSVIVNYYNGKELVNTVESFDKIVLDDFILDDENFEKWVVNTRSISDAEEIYYAPDFGIEPQYSEINVMAKFKETEPIIEPTDDPIPDPKPTKEEKPSKEKTPKSVAAVQIVDNSNPIIIASDNPQEEVKKEDVVISEPKTPKAVPEKYWALLNLILSILTVIGGIIFLLHKKDEELEEEDSKKVNRFKALSTLTAIASVIIFILTEDMTATMAWVDKWTIAMAVVLCIELIEDYYIHKNSKYEEEEEKEY